MLNKSSCGWREREEGGEKTQSIVGEREKEKRQGSKANSNPGRKMYHVVATAADSMTFCDLDHIVAAIVVAAKKAFIVPLTNFD